VLSCCLRCALKPSASATSSSRSCTSTSGCTSPLRPTGYSVYASPALFAAFRRLRHGRKTRYGWVASPYPTGTFTPQETLSLSQRDNARAKRRGGKAKLRSPIHNPRPLERRVGRPLRERKPGLNGFCSLLPHPAQYAEYRYCALAALTPFFNYFSPRSIGY